MREWSDQLLDGQHCVPLHLHMAKWPHAEPDRRVTTEIRSPPESPGAVGMGAMAWHGQGQALQGFPSEAGKSGVSMPRQRKQEDQASGPKRETTGKFRNWQDVTVNSTILPLLLRSVRDCHLGGDTATLTADDSARHPLRLTSAALWSGGHEPLRVLLDTLDRHTVAELQGGQWETMETRLTGKGGRILKWVAMPFSRQSSWPRDLPLVSCLLHRQAGLFFTTVPPGKPILEDRAFLILETDLNALLLYSIGMHIPFSFNSVQLYLQLS